MENIITENNQDVIKQITDRIIDLEAEERVCRREKREFSYQKSEELKKLRVLLNHAQIMGATCVVREEYDKQCASILKMIDEKIAQAEKDSLTASEAINGYMVIGTLYDSKIYNQQLDRYQQAISRANERKQKFGKFKSEKLEYYAFLSKVIGDRPLSEEYTRELCKCIASNGYIDAQGHFLNHSDKPGLYQIEQYAGKAIVKVNEVNVKLALELMTGQSEHYNTLVIIKSKKLKNKHLKQNFEDSHERIANIIISLEAFISPKPEDKMVASTSRCVGLIPDCISDIFQEIEYFKEGGILEEVEDKSVLTEKYSSKQMTTQDIIDLANKYLNREYLEQAIKKIVDERNSEIETLLASIPEEMRNIDADCFDIITKDVKTFGTDSGYFDGDIASINNLMLLSRINNADPRILKGTLNAVHTNAVAYPEFLANSAQQQMNNLSEEIAKTR